jgi:hypothetical protein
MGKRKDSSGTLQAFLVMFGVIIVVLLLVNWSAESKRSVPGSKDLRLEACYMAQQFVEQRLKAPSTAEFQNCYDVTVSFYEPDTYIVPSYVDSQNGFGAMLRSEYRATVQHLGRDRWRLVGVTFSE